jgi:hypothetical protein
MQSQSITVLYVSTVAEAMPVLLGCHGSPTYCSAYASPHQQHHICPQHCSSFSLFIFHFLITVPILSVWTTSS